MAQLRTLPLIICFLAVARCSVAANDGVNTDDFDDSDPSDAPPQSNPGSEGADPAAALAGPASALAGLDPKELAKVGAPALMHILKGFQHAMGVNDSEMQEVIDQEMENQEKEFQKIGERKQKEMAESKLKKPKESAVEVELDPEFVVSEEEERSAREAEAAEAAKAAKRKATNAKAASRSASRGSTAALQDFFGSLYSRLLLEADSTTLLLICLLASTGFSFVLGIAYNAYMGPADSEPETSKTVKSD